MSESSSIPLMRDGLEAWWSERQTRHFAVSLRIEEICCQRKTQYQHLALMKTVEWGMLLALDNIIQLTERDEFFYHETISHPALFCLPEKGEHRVVIIGGGDGGVAREVLKHPHVVQVEQVEIDREVTEVCQKYFPCIWQRPDGTRMENDPRLRLIFTDGVAWVQERVRAGETRDLVIIDSTDPIGPAEALFGREFYQNLHQLVGPKGMVITQAGSPLMHPQNLKAGLSQLANVFAHVEVLWGPTPTYPGGIWNFGLASDHRASLRPKLAQIKQRYENLLAQGVSFRLYHPAFHQACREPFPFMKTLLNDTL